MDETEWKGDVQRYSFALSSGVGPGSVVDAEGRWVRHSDHVAALSAARLRVEGLEKDAALLLKLIRAAEVRLGDAKASHSRMMDTPMDRDQCAEVAHEMERCVFSARIYLAAECCGPCLTVEEVPLARAALERIAALTPTAKGVQP